MIKHVVWDFDGTLFNTYPSIAKSFYVALLELGIEESLEQVKNLVKISEGHALDYCVRNHGVERESLKGSYDRHRKGVHLNEVMPFPNAKSVCETLIDRGVTNYIYTNRGKSVLVHLDHFECRGIFKDIIRREHNFPRKPEPDALLYLLDEHDIKADEAIMIGDRDIDILAGKNAGMQTCYFDIDYEGKVKVADYTIHTMNDLLEIVC